MKSPSRKHIKTLTVDSFRSTVKTLFEKLTEEQWNLVMSGCTDLKTRILLAEFLLDIMTLTTATLLAAIKSNPNREASIVSSMNESFPRSFSEALAIPDQAEDETLRSLSEMIQTEVRKNLETILYKNKERVTPYFGLHSMISYASGLLKRFGKKMKKSFVPKKHKQECKVQHEGYGRVLSGSDRPPKGIQEKLEEELNEIVSPMLQHVPATEYEKVWNDTVLEISVLSGDLLNAHDTTQGKKKLRKIRCKVRNFFTKCFLNVWIHHLIDQLKRTHCPSNKAESTQSIKELTDNIESWLHSKNETSIVLALDEVSNSNKLVFTETLFQLLDQYWHEHVQKFDGQSGGLPLPQLKLYVDMWRKSWTCQVMMNWFLKTVLTQLVESVNFPATKATTEPVVVPLDHTERTQDARYPANPVYIRFLIEKIVHHLCQDAKMVPNYNIDLVDHMFQKVCSELQDVECHITANSFKRLDETIHKSLCKQLGTIDETLQLWTDCCDTTVPRCIASIAKSLLKEPTKDLNYLDKILSAVKHFFSKR